jgi:HEAT repeat protein
MKPRLHCLIPAATLALLAGCAAEGPRKASMGAAGRSGHETSGFDARDPVVLSSIRERALSTVQEMAASDVPQFRANAVEAATAAPARLMPVIEQGLRDQNAGVRAVAAMAVGKARLTRVAERVRPLLRDSNPYVQSAAIFALVRCGHEVDRTPLANLLLRDPSPQVRSQVAYILGELGDVSAIKLLRAAVKEGIPNATPHQFRLFELQAAEAMIKLGDQRQRPVVRAALFPASGHELEQVALACQILGEVGDRESIHQLVSLSEYKEELLVEVPQGEAKVSRRVQGKGYPPEVQLAIAGALATMGHGDGTFIADAYAGHSSELIRSQAAYVYGQIGKLDNWGKLDTLMGDSYGGVRVAAAAAVLKSAAKSRLAY